jgi:hypothetical protein
MCKTLDTATLKHINELMQKLDFVELLVVKNYVEQMLVYKSEGPTIKQVTDSVNFKLEN